MRAIGLLFAALDPHALWGSFTTVSNGKFESSIPAEDSPMNGEQLTAWRVAPSKRFTILPLRVNDTEGAKSLQDRNFLNK